MQLGHGERSGGIGTNGAEGGAAQTTGAVATAEAGSVADGAPSRQRPKPAYWGRMTRPNWRAGGRISEIGKEEEAVTRRDLASEYTLSLPLNNMPSSPKA